ncbi:MAG: BlaI/MecI/CopY family transcriptional regulator [Bacteroidota bacterium]
MPRTLHPLGATEMQVLNLVWELGHATVADVHEQLLSERDVAYTTVMTVLKNLARKGYLRFEKDGLAYVYYPERRPEEVRGSLLAGFLDKVFRGDAAALVQSLVKAEHLSPTDRAEIQRLLDAIDGSAPDATDSDSADPSPAS